MRALPLLAILAMLTLAPSAQAGTWSPQPTGTSDTLRGVDFWNPTQGLAVGTGHTILRTGDGGATWQQVMGGMFGFGWYDVAWASPLVAYAVGANAIFQPFVGMSVNGGVSWTQTPFYIQGNEGTLHGVAAEGPVVLAAATLWSGQGNVVRTVVAPEAFISVLAAPAPLYDVALRGSLAIAVGAAGAYHSLDGGLTWSQGSLPAGTPTLLDVALQADGTAVAVGMNGAIVRSTDGGASWSAIASPTTSTLRGADFASADVGWAAGDGGVVLRTGDGGLTWAPEASGTTARLEAVAAAGVDPLLHAGWAVGQGGTAVATQEGGLPL